MYFKKNLFLSNFILFFIINNNFSMESKISKTYLHNIYGKIYASKQENFSTLKKKFNKFSNNQDFFSYFSEEIKSEEDLKFFKDYFKNKIEIFKKKNILSNFAKNYILINNILDKTDSLIKNIEEKEYLYEILNCIPNENLFQLSFDDQDNDENKNIYTHHFYSFSLKDLFGKDFNSYNNNRFNIQNFFFKELKESDVNENKNLFKMKRIFIIKDLYNNFEKTRKDERCIETYIKKLLELNLFPEYENFLIEEFSKFYNDKDTVDKNYKDYLDSVAVYNFPSNNLKYNFNSKIEIINYHKKVFPILHYIHFPDEIILDDFYLPNIINNNKNGNSLVLLHELGHVTEKFLYGNTEDINQFDNGFISVNLKGFYSNKDKKTITIGLTRKLNSLIINCNSFLGNDRKISALACELFFIDDKMSDIVYLMQFTKINNPKGDYAVNFFIDNCCDFSCCVDNLLKDKNLLCNLKSLNEFDFLLEELKNIIFVYINNKSNLFDLLKKDFEYYNPIFLEKFKKIMKVNENEIMNYVIKFLLLIKKNHFDVISKYKLNKIKILGQKIIDNNYITMKYDTPFYLLLGNLNNKLKNNKNLSSFLNEEKKALTEFLSESGQAIDKFIELQIPKDIFKK